MAVQRKDADAFNVAVSGTWDFILHPLKYFSGESSERRRFRKDLKRLYVDGEALRQRNISTQDLFAVRKYVLHLQEDYVGSTGDGLFYFGKQKGDLWHQTILSGRREEATRAVIHEVTEMRALAQKGVDLLKYPPHQARSVLEQNKDCHMKALLAEYGYWREKNKYKSFDEFTKTLHPDDVEMFTTEYLKLTGGNQE
ncbi:MAG: hypothetical protein KKD39_00945 [Candidatus Altiarchaeota archaeon]|nr:hypothetical protein [Candidatus Altiarchaeota archaeon]